MVLQCIMYDCEASCFHTALCYDFIPISITYVRNCARTDDHLPAVSHMRAFPGLVTRIGAGLTSIDYPPYCVGSAGLDKAPRYSDLRFLLCDLYAT